MEYTFIIKDKRYAGFKKLSAFLFLINAVIFISFALNAQVLSARLVVLAAAIVLLSYAIYSWYRPLVKDLLFIPVYILAAVVWITDTSYWYFSIIMLLLMLLQYRMQKPLSIQFTPEAIFISGFMEKIHEWNEFDNIVLRDDLLTLDFNNNKILQAEPERLSQEDYRVLEKEFNEFCMQRLSKPN